MSNRNSSPAKRIALNGILLAFTAITLFLASTLPVNEMSLYALSSFFVSIIIIEFGIKAGWFFYVASCLLSLVIPNKAALVPYIVFFGLYGIVKYYIEKMNQIVVEYILKLSFFNLFLVLTLVFLRQVISGSFSKYPLWLVIVGLEAAFIVYDYAYTLFIQYYRNRIRGMLKI